MNFRPNQFPDDRAALGHLLGELDESGTEQYFAALREWRDESEAIAESPLHIPAAILSRWPQLRPSVSPLERDLIESHLRKCEDCRNDLAFADRFTGVGTPARPRARILPWIGGGLVGAAIAASLLLAILPGDTPGPSLQSMNWVAPSFTRGIGSEVALPETGEALVLVIPVGTPRSGMLRVEILDTDDRVLFEQEIPADEVHGGSLLLQWQGDPTQPWRTGRYRCRVHDGDRVRDGEFMLVP